MAFIDQTTAEGKPVLVHCLAGQGRTGCILHAYYLLKGYSLTGAQWQAALEVIALEQGWIQPGSRLRFAGVPWLFMRLGAWAVPMWASVLEMRYLWNTPHELDNRKLVALTGPEPHTPLETALRQSLEALGLTSPPRKSANAPRN